MVQINLLPAAAKKKQRIKAELTIKVAPLIFVLAGVILIVIAVWTILGIQLLGKQRELARLDKQLKAFQGGLQNLDQLTQDKKQAQEKLEFLDSNLKREVFWAKNLNRLNNLVPLGIWLKKVSLETRKEEHLKKYASLSIDGSAVSVQGEEMIDLIGGFMSVLKKDEVFSEQFSEIKLISSRRKKIGNFDVMDFNLYCQFR